MRPVLKYPGGKWAYTDWILRCLPAHAHYIEPYFGSGAVFFNKEPAPHEVINDLNDDVVRFFEVLRTRGTELAEQTALTPWARSEFEACTGPGGVVKSSDDPLEHARRFLVRCWQAHGTRQGTKAGWRHDGKIGEGYPVRQWRKIPDYLLAAIDRLRDVEIEHRPALEIIRRYNVPDALIYADPPYVAATRNTYVYQHDMTNADHIAMLDALDAHSGPVVLSGYHCPLYDERLVHWTACEKIVQAEKGNLRTEVLWLNPVCVERLGYGPLFAREHGTACLLTQGS